MSLELVVDRRAVRTSVAVIAFVGVGAYALGRYGAISSSPTPAASPAPTPQPAPAVSSAPSGALVFADEFDGDRLDTQRWSDAYPGGKRTHANNERQYYAPDGLKVAGGKLIFTAQRRSMGGMEFTSGMVSSFGHFAQRYGRFEMRAKFPKGQGLWPAFWLLPEDQSWPPEIDIIEVLGHQPKTYYFSNHFSAGGGHKWDTFQSAVSDWSADFHTYTLEWKPGRMTWLLDGKPMASTDKNVPDKPMYVLANLAVGGDWPGFPNATTPFPSSMEVDYIRVWAP